MNAGQMSQKLSLLADLELAEKLPVQSKFRNLQLVYDEDG
jgi:hypothetical protein